MLWENGQGDGKTCVVDFPTVCSEGTMRVEGACKSTSVGEHQWGDLFNVVRAAPYVRRPMCGALPAVAACAALACIASVASPTRVPAVSAAAASCSHTGKLLAYGAVRGSTGQSESMR